MSQTEIFSNINDLICGLKAAATYLECQHDIFLKQSNSESSNEPVPYREIPICKNEMKQVPRNKPRKCKNQKLMETDDGQVAKNKQCLPKYKSPEMKMSYLHYNCLCLHRNGLQDECPLTGCKGQPQCLVKPWPKCPPGKYYMARNPELYPIAKKRKKC